MLHDRDRRGRHAANGNVVGKLLIARSDQVNRKFLGQG